jgi:hypothetical protein
MATTTHMTPENLEFIKPMFVTAIAFVASVALDQVTTSLDWLMQLARFIVILAMVIGGIKTLQTTLFPKKIKPDQP